MSYLLPVLILLLVISPALIPAIITGVHRTVDGIRAVASRRRTATAPTLT